VKAILISIEEYRGHFARLDLKVGKTGEVHVCDFCFNEIGVGDEVYSAPDMLSCLSLLHGVDMCSSCFRERSSSRSVECFVCELCSIKSIVDVQVYKHEKWRRRFCTECKDNKPPCFEVSPEERASWRTHEDLTDMIGWLRNVPKLSKQMFDSLMDYYTAHVLKGNSIVVLPYTEVV